MPICFPWFGPHPHGEGPDHGLARLQDWSLTRSTIGDDGSVSVLLGLPETGPRTSPDWPERLVARCRVTAGRSLRLDLTVRNADAVTATFQAALHTYLRVSDVRRVTVYGLEDMPYIDSAAGGAARDATGQPLRLECRTDRIYRQPGSITVDDPGADRVITSQWARVASVAMLRLWVTAPRAVADAHTILPLGSRDRERAGRLTRRRPAASMDPQPILREPARRRRNRTSATTPRATKPLTRRNGAPTTIMTMTSPSFGAGTQPKPMPSH